VVLGIVFRPESRAVGSVDTCHTAERAERVDFAVVNRRRSAGAVAVIELAVRDRFALCPQHFACVGIETCQSLLLDRLQHPVGDKDPPTGDRNARVAATDGPLPQLLQAILGPLFGELGPLPGLVAPRTSPARPVFGRYGNRAESENCQKDQSISDSL